MPSFDPNWGKIPSRRAGGGLPAQGAPEKETLPVEIHNGFYSGLPFDKINYYHRNVWIDWPGIPPAGGAQTTMFTEDIKKGMVLLLTSIMYRASATVPGVAPTHVLLGDAHLLASARFELTYNNNHFYDVQYQTTVTGVAQSTATTEMLNQDLLIPELQYALLVEEGSRLNCILHQNFTAGPIPSPALVGVQLRGMWMTRGEYNSWQRRLVR